MLGVSTDPTYGRYGRIPLRMVLANTGLWCVPMVSAEDLVAAEPVMEMKACPVHSVEHLQHLNHCMSAAQNPLTMAPIMNVMDEIACALDVDLSALPSDIRGTSRQLASRHVELGKWQSQTALSISRVEREIDALEKLKHDIEELLEERQTYAKFITECVKFKEDFEQFSREDVYSELRSEQQLINEIISTLRNHLFLLHGQIDSLKDIHKHLVTDFEDKSHAIKLTANCITHSNPQQCPKNGSKKWHITYDEWKTECGKLQNTSDSLVAKSSDLRGNVQFTLTNIKNACARQRANTSKTMRKRIHDLKKKEVQMRWKLQQAVSEMEDLTKTAQKVLAQIRNCEARRNENASNLDALNQRERNELCLDQAHNSLTLEKCDLNQIVTGLERMKRHVYAKMEVARSRIPVLQRELDAQLSAVQAELKCQDIYLNILPVHEASVGPMNDVTGPVNFLERLQPSHQ
ncbi:hypothetical protein WMY93_022336 [Mugilogobius chulae]|uniref:Tektin n=1 Tax=Mugilogobius chulae TaxID=88201 RepID=A0AAW0NCH1_9GOBI